MAVVTGAGRGIGAATARALAEAGLTVVLAARNREQIERQTARLVAMGHKANAVDCDVTNEASVEALSAARPSWDRWRAGEQRRRRRLDATCTNLARRLEPPHRRQRHRRLPLHSGIPSRHARAEVGPGGQRGVDGGAERGKYLAAYSAAKHALVGLTRSTAAEVAGTGVTANAVCPGFVDTEMTAETVDRIVARTGRTREEALAAALASAGQTRLIGAERGGRGRGVAHGRRRDSSPKRRGPGPGWERADERPLCDHQPGGAGRARGWNNGMLAQAGVRTLFIAGQTARDGTGRVPAADFVSQFDRALGNILSVLQQAGGEPGDVGRFTIYVTDMVQYRVSLKPLGEVYRRRMGTHFPAMALVEVKSLVDPQALVEIEATAVL